MTKKIDILGIIPARGGSKGIPYKNIAPLGDKPLIYYTIKAVQESKLLDAFIVTTDSPKIATLAKSLGADVPFLRPKKISGDKATDIQFLRHAIDWLEEHRNWRPKITVILRPTAPFRTAEDIDNFLEFMIQEGCDSVRTISAPNPHNPYKMWRLVDATSKKIKPLLPTKYYPILGTDVPRQWLPTVYWQNGAIDATLTKFIKKNKMYGKDIRGFVMNPEKIVDLDTPQDLKKAEIILAQYKYDKNRNTKRTLL